MNQIVTVGIILLAIHVSILGHAHWIQPLPRAGENVSLRPCGGKFPGVPADTVVRGDTLTVRWQEYQNHNSTYIVSYSTNRDTTFTELLRTPDTAVNGIWTRRIVLPATVLGAVTLQLNQGNAYFSCTDVLVLDSPATRGEALPPAGSGALSLSGNPLRQGQPLVFFAGGKAMSGLTVHSAVGQCLFSTDRLKVEAGGKVSVLLPPLPSGIYLASLKVDGVRETRRFVIR